MKKLSILLAVVLVISLASFALASGPRTTGFQIQNLSSSNAAVTIYYYKTDGTLQCSVSDTINASASKSYYQGASDWGCTTGTTPTGSWQGSVVIESDQPVAVITNIAESTNYASGAYVGTPDTVVGKPLILPAIMGGSGFYGFTTDFALQNAGSSTATCPLRFVKTDGTESKTINVTIAPGASYYRDQEADDKDLGSKWLGVVVADCDQPMAGTVNQKPLSGGAGALLTYDAVAADKIPGGGEISLPVIMWDYYNYWTGVQIVATAANTSGTVKFYDGTTEAFSENFGPLGQYGSHTVLPSWVVGGTFTGTVNTLYSGKITFTSGSGTAMVNQRDKPGKVGMTYSGIYAANTTANLSIPFAARCYYGVSTGFQVVNSGTGGNITVYYDPTPGTGSGTPAPVTIALGAGAAVPLQQFLSGGNDPSLSGCTDTSCGSHTGGYCDQKWTGSIRVVGAAGMKLSAIVNERGFSDQLAPLGDVGMVYNAFNY